MHLTKKPHFLKLEDVFQTKVIKSHIEGYIQKDQVSNIFLSTFYDYPNIEVRSFHNTDRQILYSKDLLESWTFNIKQTNTIFLEGNIGDGKSTLLNKICIDLDFEKEIIPIFFTREPLANSNPPK